MLLLPAVPAVPGARHVTVCPYFIATGRCTSISFKPVALVHARFFPASVSTAFVSALAWRSAASAAQRSNTLERGGHTPQCIHWPLCNPYLGSALTDTPQRRVLYTATVRSRSSQ